MILPASAEKKISEQTFQTFIRPALSGILNDFYQMIVLFPEFPKELVDILDDLSSLSMDKEALREKCPQLLTVVCQENITTLRKKLSELKVKSTKLIGHQKMSPTLPLNTLSGIRMTNDFLLELEQVKGLLDNSSLMIKAQVPNRRESHLIIKHLDQMNTYLSLTLVEYIPFPYKEDFRHFYFNFIHPIQQQIASSKNYEFLNHNVNSLNIAINLLNMNLTKRNKKTPEGMGPYLNLIHNRWNGLLRYYL
jgi:hypothetical protein